MPGIGVIFALCSFALQAVAISISNNAEGTLEAGVGSCAYDGVLHDFDGDDVQSVQCTGNSDADKDASCCQQCNQNPSCQYWVRATNSNSGWLKKNFRGYRGAGDRRGNFKFPAFCAWDGTNHDFNGADVALVQSPGSSDAEKDTSCCQQCNSNPSCQFWVRATDSNNCWLKRGFTGFGGAGNRRGNFKTSRVSCGFDGFYHDFSGTDVASVQYTGNTEEEKDAFCCQQCNSNPQCQFWVRARNSGTCWLKRDFNGFNPANTDRRGNFRAGSCVWDGTPQDYQGTDIQKTVYTGTTDAEKDASCCRQCDQNQGCTFWVRSTDTNECWLKTNFGGFRSANNRRGNFRSTDIICPDPTPPTNGNNGNCAGIANPNSCLQKCNQDYTISGGTWSQGTTSFNGIFGPYWEKRMGDCIPGLTRDQCSDQCNRKPGCLSVTYRPPGGESNTGCCLFPWTCPQWGVVQGCSSWSGAAYWQLASLTRTCQTDGNFSPTVATCQKW